MERNASVFSITDDKNQGEAWAAEGKYMFFVLSVLQEITRARKSQGLANSIACCIEDSNFISGIQRCALRTSDCSQLLS